MKNLMIEFWEANRMSLFKTLRKHLFTSTSSLLEFQLNDDHGHGQLGQSMEYNMAFTSSYDSI